MSRAAWVSRCCPRLWHASCFSSSVWSSFVVMIAFRQYSVTYLISWILLVCVQVCSVYLSGCLSGGEQSCRRLQLPPPLCLCCFPTSKGVRCCGSHCLVRHPVCCVERTRNGTIIAFVVMRTLYITRCVSVSEWKTASLNECGFDARVILSSL